LNIAYNALDYHVANGRGDQVALIYDSPMTSTIQHFTYKQLLEESSRLAGAFRNVGAQQNDVILLYMPMIPQAIFTILACARLGVTYSVVFGGFASGELSKRICDLKPKIIVSGSCGLEPTRVVPYKPMLDEAIRISEHIPKLCVIVQRPEYEAELVKDRDIEWNSFLEKHGETVDAVPVRSNHPFFVLHTSGTTGTPKGVIRDTGGYAVATKYCIQRVFGLKPGDRYFVSSDIGWVVGNTMFWGPIMSGVTTILFEGKPVGTPDAGAYWRIITEHKINMAFAAPTAIRAIRREDPEGKLMKKYNLTSSPLKAFWLAGERADPETVKWAEQYIHVPCIDNYWQTETGWPVITDSIGIHFYPIKPGEPLLFASN
jgi:propionyl-CoA synthetase